MENSKTFIGFIRHSERADQVSNKGNVIIEEKDDPCLSNHGIIMAN